MSIQSIIITNTEKLIQQMIPTISQIVEKTGIQNIGQPDMKMPGVCLLPNGLQDILVLRNKLMSKLNFTSNKINLLSKSLNKSLNPLSTIVDTTSKTLKTVRTARIAANASLAFIVPPLTIPGTIPSAINIAKDLEELLTPQVTIAKNSITSITTALDYANSTIFKLLNLLKIIDQYLIRCGVSNLTPANDYVNKVNQQYTEVQLLPSNIEVYRGFTLEIVEEPFSPTVNRRKGVAKNNQGIILLSTPLSFTTTPQVLIEELKLIIDSNDLKAN